MNKADTRAQVSHCFNKDGSKLFKTARKNIDTSFLKKQNYTFSALDYEVAPPIVHWTYKDKICNKRFYLTSLKICVEFNTLDWTS